MQEKLEKLHYHPYFNFCKSYIINCLFEFLIQSIRWKKKLTRLLDWLATIEKKNTEFFIIVKLGDKELFGHPKIVP